MSRGSREATTRARTGRVAVVLAAATVAAIGLVAKAASEARLGDSTVDLGLLQLELAYNSGVAFSMGNTLAAGVLVAVTATIAVALMAYAWHRAPHAGWVERIAGGAVIGGAVAKVVDRARDGVVTDYLHSGWWPTFNLADTLPDHWRHRDRPSAHPPRTHYGHRCGAGEGPHRHLPVHGRPPADIAIAFRVRNYTLRPPNSAVMATD